VKVLENNTDVAAFLAKVSLREMSPVLARNNDLAGIGSLQAQNATQERSLSAPLVPRTP
jgi:hypothetical protein